MKIRKNTTLLVSALGVSIGMLINGLPPVLAQEVEAVTGEKVVEFKGEPYPLSTCAVSGEELGDDVITKEFGGREVRFCCDGCVTKFEKDPDKYWARVDAKIIEVQLPWYPEMTCPVSGGELGGMGETINYVYKNRLVRFCCTGCIKSFEKEPAQYIAKIDEQVIAQQVADYPLEECLVSNGALEGMGGPLNQVYANRLVRFCCAGCVKRFKENPAKYFAVIDKAYGENSPARLSAEGQAHVEEKSAENQGKDQGLGG